MLDENKLKNCPFCGGKPSVWIVDRIIKIRCEKCKYERYFNGIITPVPHKVEAGNDEYYNPNAYEEAIKAWNKRVESEKQEVRHGQWLPMHYEYGILDGDNFDKCSVCGYERLVGDVKYKTTYNLCPNCDAKMDKE